MSKNITIQLIFVSILALFFTLQPLQYSVFGADKDLMSKGEAEEALRAITPDVKVLSVEHAPVSGLWEITVQGGGKKGIVYIDSARKNVVIGSIVDLKSKTNLTQKKFDDINRIDTSLIPLDDALVMGSSMARHRVIVFDDPDCPYCAKLHPELKKIVKDRNDVAFYFKIFPILQLHPEAYEKSKTILCEKSNEKALGLLEDVFDKKTIPKPSCDTEAVDENIELAKRLGISGTPTLIFSDGRVVSGALKADDLIKMIENN
jgi:thiol:disulfide interchange protein DsbC